MTYKLLTIACILVLAKGSEDVIIEKLAPSNEIVLNATFVEIQNKVKSCNKCSGLLMFQPISIAVFLENNKLYHYIFFSLLIGIACNGTN